MDQTCYKLPIRFEALLGENGAEPQMCSEVESISQHIELLLTTCPGEHKFDKNYGCRIWDMDFERVVSRQKWEEDFSRYIFDAIEQYERRIKDVKIALEIMEVAQEDSVAKTTAIKKKVIVQVKGQLLSTNAPCSYSYKLYLGPLSSE